MLNDLGELDILGTLKFSLRERLREIFWRRGIKKAIDKGFSRSLDRARLLDGTMRPEGTMSDKHGVRAGKRG